MGSEFQIDRLKQEDIVKQLESYTGGAVSEDCDEWILNFTNDGGNGIIRGMNFEHGMGLSSFELTLDEGICLNYTIGNLAPLYIIACLEQEVELLHEKRSVKIHPGHSILFSPGQHDVFSIRIPEKKYCRFVVLDVVRILFLRKVECDLHTVPPSLQETFRDTRGEEQFYYSCKLTPPLISSVQHMFGRDKKGLERKLMLEARALELVMGMIKHYRIENSVMKDRYIFKTEDITMLNRAKDILMDSVDEPPTIQKLSMTVGMSKNKLQRGFQLILGQSIKQFVISVRMHRARTKLEEDDQSIGEIAAEVGYTNKGHFSELFKKEFGMLPKDYRAYHRK